MPRTKKPAEPADLSWKKIRITADNYRDVLSQDVYEAVHKGMHDAKWFPMAKIAIGVGRGLGIFGDGSGGDTNNFYFQMMNMSLDDLKKLKELNEAGKTITLNPGTGDSGRSGDTAAGNSRANQPVTALLAPAPHKNVR